MGGKKTCKHHELFENIELFQILIMRLVKFKNWNYQKYFQFHREFFVENIHY